jgi:ABC-type glycerol-3-phosphate transport system substrate-binding protein
MLWDSGGGIDVEWLGPTYYAAMKADQLIGQFAAAWEGGFWQSNLKPTEGGLGNWRVAKLPKGPGIKYRTGIFGGAQLVCPKCAKNKENAVLYMKYALGGLEGAALCGKWGIIPAYRPYLQSPLFLRSKTPLFGDWPYNEFWAAQEKEMSLEYFRPAGWNETNTAIEQIMPDIMSGKIGIKAGLDEAVKKAQVEFDRVRCKV